MVQPNHNCILLMERAGVQNMSRWYIRPADSARSVRCSNMDGSWDQLKSKEMKNSTDRRYLLVQWHLRLVHEPFRVDSSGTVGVNGTYIANRIDNPDYNEITQTRSPVLRCPQVQRLATQSTLLTTTMSYTPHAEYICARGSWMRRGAARHWIAA